VQEMLRASARDVWVLPALAAIVWLGWSCPAYAARCGTVPGDAAALAATRAAMNAQCPCATATDRGDYVRCAKGVVAQAVEQGMLPQHCASAAKKCATRSTCGRPAGWVTCCRTTASGKTKCKVKSSPAKCRAPSGGQSCTTGFTSCCDACTASGCVPTPTLVPTDTPTITQTPSQTPTPSITATPTVPLVCEGLVTGTPIAQVPITLAAGSADCGGPQLRNPEPQPPHSGAVQDGDGQVLGNFGLGCLYSGALPPLQLPSGATAIVDVVGFNLVPLALTLAGSEGSGPTDCTKGAGPGRKCANGALGLDGMGTCNFDADCGPNEPTACALEPNCYFGPPIPLPLGALSSCVVNAFLTDLCGQINLETQQSNFATALSSRVYLTFNEASPCPRCEGGLCNGGDRAGLPCTPLGSAQTSLDCPPAASAFAGALTVVANLTSGTSTLSASDGFFCPDQTEVGAIGLDDARMVTEMGTPPSLNGLALSTSLGAVFCIPQSGAEVLDVVARLPTVGAFAVASDIDLASVLLP